MFEKAKTAIWFAGRPTFWAHGAELARRKFLPDYDKTELRDKAGAWAASQAVPIGEALARLGISGELRCMSKSALETGRERARQSAVEMGGPGDLDLLFDAVRLTGSKRVVETGVAYGWSSLAILSAMAETGGGHLWSVDMPYPKQGNERFVGIVVPEELRSSWTLIREPDRKGLEKAIRAAGGQLDLCHYDSDKSWHGRGYAFPLLWEALAPGGLFISDDIQDNLYFAEFVKEKGLTYSITESDGKYVGLFRKT